MEPIDCTRCGACCVSNWDLETYVGVSEKDQDRLLPIFDEEELDRLVGHRHDRWQASLRTKENVQGHITCIALDGRVGECVSCSIYESRPDACRHFKSGSLECRAAREEAGLTDPVEGSA